MTVIVKVYIDINGMPSKTLFISDQPNYDHAQNDDPALVGVILTAAEYQNSAPAIASNGLAYASALNATLAGKLGSSPALQARILANNANPDAATLAVFNSIMLAAGQVVIGP